MQHAGNSTSELGVQIPPCRILFDLADLDDVMPVITVITIRLIADIQRVVDEPMRRIIGYMFVVIVEIAYCLTEKVECDPLASANV